jgi:hypothetical protein
MNRPHTSSFLVPLITLGLLLAGCTPLARTSYPVVYDQGYLGTWQFEWNADLIPAGQQERPPSLVAEITPMQAPADYTRPPAGQLAEVWPRLRITISGDSNELKVPLEIDGGLLDSGARIYFTFQQSSGQVNSIVSLLHTPLQHTVRAEREGDTIRIYAHRVMLIWTPMEFAGTLTPALPDHQEQEASRRLLQSFDQIIAWYDAAPDDTWLLLGTATRAQTPAPE